MEFTNEDLRQISKHKLTPEQVQQQLDDFANGFPYVSVKRAATRGDGIRKYDKDVIAEYVKLYEENQDNYSVMKFVPSSGAATRMMKDMYNFVNEYVDEDVTPIENFPEAKKTIDNIEKFAFYELLNKVLVAKTGKTAEELRKEKDYKPVINAILSDDGLGYGKYPKAWILFHKLDGRSISAFEQHLLEGVQYAKSNGEVNMEFTVTDAHLHGFKALHEALVPLYEKKYGVKYNINYTFQKPSTDTIAVDMQNEPIHDSNGNLVFRPAGHGSLITNLNKLSADVIFIKNIDNISLRYIEETAYYKKLLAGVLIETKQKINSLLKKLHKKEVSKQELVSIYNTVKNKLGLTNVENHTESKTLFQYKKYLTEFLNRPVRVCGMVRNTGEPGGGPFVVEKDGKLSLQIVEKAQVNMQDPIQKVLFLTGTHFNPVDLVVSTVDWEGKKFNLQRYVDLQSGFITEKSYEGVRIKAMERPGLWNGAMFDWITILVEVPLETFSPVKTLNDLLRAPHQTGDV